MDVPTSTAEAPQITLESLAADIQDLRLRIARQVTRDVARRNKLLALQAAVVRRHGDAVCDSDDVIAPVFPIERVAHDKPMARILAFGSMGDNFGMTTTEFFKQLHAFDVEVYFFKDFEQIWYMKGLLGLSTDIDSTVTVIREMLPDDGLPILTLGASSGGFAALLFGRLLGASRTIAFSPQSEVSRQVFSRFKSVDSNDEDFEIIKAYGSLRKVYDETPATGKARILFRRARPPRRATGAADGRMRRGHHGAPAVERAQHRQFPQAARPAAGNVVRFCPRHRLFRRLTRAIVPMRGRVPPDPASADPDTRPVIACQAGSPAPQAAPVRI